MNDASQEKFLKITDYHTKVFNQIIEKYQKQIGVQSQFVVAFLTEYLYDLNEQFFDKPDNFDDVVNLSKYEDLMFHLKADCRNPQTIIERANSFFLDYKDDIQNNGAYEKETNEYAKECYY